MKSPTFNIACKTKQAINDTFQIDRDSIMCQVICYIVQRRPLVIKYDISNCDALKCIKICLTVSSHITKGIREYLIVMHVCTDVKPVSVS